MYNGVKRVIHRRCQKSKVTQDGIALTVSPGVGSVNTSLPVVVRGYESLVVYGSYSGASDEVEIDIMPVDVDEVTVLDTPIATFTLMSTLMDDNISIVRGRPAVAIRVVNKSTTETATVSAKIVCTWR